MEVAPVVDAADGMDSDGSDIGCVWKEDQ